MSQYSWGWWEGKQLIIETEMENIFLFNPEEIYIK